jgi:TrmH RNA methyltransferase
VQPEKLCRIAGIAAVSAVFRQHPERAVRLYYEDSLKPAVGRFCADMARRRLVYREVTSDELERIAGTSMHGGVVLAATPLVPARLDTAKLKAWKDTPQSIVVLDGIGNPQNIGAIGRTLAYLGIRRLLLSDHPAQAGLSDAACRIAEGGMEYLDIVQATNMPVTLKALKPAYHVVGTALSRDAVTPEALLAASGKRPLVLVMGNEEHGLDRATLQACDAVVCIPGSGQVQSLNVSASLAILAHRLLLPSPTVAGGRPAPSPRRGGRGATRK